jgi:UDP-N-acetylglucosamine 2-epimerase (non-hydrolysing)
MSAAKPLVFAAGARPNFIKIAPLLRALARQDPDRPALLVHTGQHYDDRMSAVFFRQLGIPEPVVDLGVGPGPHGLQTGRVLERFETYLAGLGPLAGVVVVGDVNSTLACALAAVKLELPVAHVEAGLRSFDRGMPEEINRILTDQISDLLLASEPSGVENLEREGIAPERVRLVGNVMIDSLLAELGAARQLELPARLGLAPRGYAYVTLHRPSNVDRPGRLAELTELLGRVAGRLPLLAALHPRTRERLREFELEPALQRADGLRILPPQGYRESLALLAEARLTLTDSGGVQEEASVLGVPCLTLRDTTERPITVSCGTNTVVGGELGAAERLVDEILAGRYKKGGPIPGWDGHAAERAIAALLERWCR